MAKITACPSCSKQNRVPAAATGKPACAVCGASLPWIVEATDATPPVESRQSAVR